MTQVFFMPEAERQRDLELDWWLENRPTNPFLFLDELNETLLLFQSNPLAGRLYRKQLEVRVYLLPGTRYQVFYRYLQAEDVIRIHAVWGAQRRRGPPLSRP